MQPGRPSFSVEVKEDKDKPWVYQQGKTVATFYEKINSGPKDRAAVHLESERDGDGQTHIQSFSCDSMTTLQRMEERSNHLKATLPGSTTLQQHNPDSVENIGNMKASYWVINKGGGEKEVVSHLTKFGPDGKTPVQGITLNDSILKGVVDEGREANRDFNSKYLSAQERQLHDKEAQNVLLDKQRESDRYVLVKWVNGNHDPKTDDSIRFDTAHRENTHKITGADFRDFQAEMTGEPRNFRGEPLWVLVEKSPMQTPEEANGPYEPKNFSNTHGKVIGVFDKREEGAAAFATHEKARQEEITRRAEVQEQATSKFQEQSFTMNRSDFTQKRSM